jgi:hypothetical protein
VTAERKMTREYETLWLDDPEWESALDQEAANGWRVVAATTALRGTDDVDVMTHDHVMERLGCLILEREDAEPKSKGLPTCDDLPFRHQARAALLKNAVVLIGGVDECTEYSTEVRRALTNLNAAAKQLGIDPL